MTSHSSTGPSRMGRIVQCPGSMQMEKLYDKKTGEVEADEGNEAHGCAAMALKAPEFLTETWIPEDMLPHVKLYVDDVHRIIEARRLSTDFLHVEQRVEIPQIHDDCYGTLDAGIFDPATSELIIWDYKYGWLLVDEWENWQGLCYGLGLNRFYNARRLIVRIVQPRPYCHRGRIREWIVDVPTGGPGAEDSIYARMLYTMQSSVREAYSDKPMLRSGKECSYCSALLNCPAADKAVGLALEAVSRRYSIRKEPAEIGQELLILHEAARTIKHRITAIEELVLSHLKRGRPVPGWGTANVPGRQAWNAPEEQVLAMGQWYGADLSRPGLITPRQAEAKKVPWSVIEEYIKTPTTIKLVPDDGRKLQQILLKEK